MKNFMRKLPVKIICFALCVLFLCATVASATVAAVIALEGFYTDSRAELVWDAAFGAAYDDAYVIAYFTVSGKDYKVGSTYAPDKTNLRYAFFDTDESILSTNCNGKGDWAYYFSFRKYNDGANWNVYLLGADSEKMSGDDICVLALCLDPDLPVFDGYSFCVKSVSICYALRYWIYAIILGSFALFLTLYVALLCASGRKPDSSNLHPGYLHNVPFDMLLAGTCALAIPFLVLLDGTDRDVVAFALAMVISVLVASIAFVGLSMSIAARIKARELFKNTLVWRVCKFIWKGLRFIGRGIANVARSLPIIWRAVTVLACNAFLDFVIILLIGERSSEEFGIFLFFFKLLAVFGFGLYAAIFMRKLQKGANALAQGDLAYQTDTNGMFWDFKKHGENLNRISEGMAVAVDKRLQSERMKAELVTNVSHDIKTPLTSIINYSELIAKDECNCSSHKEYGEVLLRKSEHLKRLLDDLVEISKANTGNLEVDLLPCDVCVLLSQAGGEFVQKCENANLTLVSDIPEDSIKIMADSRRIWRVFENLMNNAVKYSLSGSRVYLSVNRVDDEAHIIFRNTSGTVINVSPDELAERFMRGDASRTTEGNGLGLSIAKSLTELQNGKMEIVIDGDLFKVTLKFPII